MPSRWPAFLRRFMNGSQSSSSSSARQMAPSNPRRYEIRKEVGKGAFGFVYEAKDRSNGRRVAVKKVLADNNQPSQELQMTQEVAHPNVISFIGYFEEIINELFSFQMFRVLHYLHLLRIVHRDIKPANLLIHAKTKSLKLCDFGSAKRIEAGTPSAAYVCSRPYRAPELHLGCEDYGEKVDIWAAGCVLAECILGDKLFKPSQNPYARICDILGDPSIEEMKEMQPIMKNYNPPAIRRGSTLPQRFTYRSPVGSAELICQIIRYKPSERPSAIQICANPFFDKLRIDAKYDEILYNFTSKELEDMTAVQIERIIPQRCRNDNVINKLNQLESSGSKRMQATSVKT